jgi:hypothetical protein
MAAAPAHKVALDLARQQAALLLQLLSQASQLRLKPILPPGHPAKPPGPTVYMGRYTHTHGQHTEHTSVTA